MKKFSSWQLYLENKMLFLSKSRSGQSKSNLPILRITLESRPDPKASPKRDPYSPGSPSFAPALSLNNFRALNIFCMLSNILTSVFSMSLNSIFSPFLGVWASFTGNLLFCFLMFSSESCNNWFENLRSKEGIDGSGPAISSKLATLTYLYTEELVSKATMKIYEYLWISANFTDTSPCSFGFWLNIYRGGQLKNA